MSEILAAEDALTLLEVRLEWADVSLVDIINDDGGHSNDLSRSSRHDSHQNEEKHGVLSGGAEELLGDKRSSQALADIIVSQHGRALGGGEAQVGQAHGGGQGEGDGKPDQTSADEAPDALENTDYKDDIQKSSYISSFACCMDFRLTWRGLAATELCQ